MCPGRHVADTMMWIVVASVLAAFSVGRAKDAAGREVAVGCEYTDSLVRCARALPLFVARGPVHPAHLVRVLTACLGSGVGFGAARSHPLPFKCAIAPRDRRAEELVRATELS